MVKAFFIAVPAIMLLWVLADPRAGYRVRRWSAALEAVSPNGHRWAAFVLITAWTVWLCNLKIRQQALVRTGFDLAIYANVAWHMVHGPLFYDAIFDRNILSGHFSPIYLGLGLLYRLYQHPATLMVVQSVGLGLGAVALYLVSERILGYSFWSFGALSLYCSHSYLHIAHAKDFHTNMLAIPVLLWMLVAVERRNRWLVFLLGVVALTIEEGVPPAVIGVGVYLIVRRPEMRGVGVLLVGTAMAYFLIVIGVVMPALYKPGGHMLWDRYAHLGGSLREAVMHLVTRPVWALEQAVLVDSKYFYLLAFFGSLGFLPLLAWREAGLTALPLLAMVLSQNPGQYKLGFHYSATALPFLYYAAVYGLRAGREALTRWPVASEQRLRFAMGVVLALVGFNVSQSPNYDLRHVDHAYVAIVRQALDDVPGGASVAATGALVPQLVDRHLVCYVQWEPGRLCEWGAPQFVILDMGAQRYPEVPLSVRRRYLTSLVEDLGYTIVHQREDLMTLRGSERLGPQFAPSPMRRTF